MALHPYFRRAGRLLAVAVAGAALVAPAPSAVASPVDTAFERSTTAVDAPRDTHVPPKRMEDLTEAEILASRGQGAPRPQHRTSDEPGADPELIGTAGAVSVAALAAAALITRRRARATV